MTVPEKVTELINMYYNCNAKSQREAIETVEEVVFIGMCQKIDSLHNHVTYRKDYDEALIISAINQLKWDQEMAFELNNRKNKLPVT